MATAEQLAKSRIEAIFTQAEMNARATGADPAEAMMDILTAAAVIAGRMKAKTTTLDALSGSLPYAVTCAEDWFPASRRVTN